jgi:hypothetical protein
LGALLQSTSAALIRRTAPRRRNLEAELLTTGANYHAAPSQDT